MWLQSEANYPLSTQTKNAKVVTSMTLWCGDQTQSVLSQTYTKYWGKGNSEVPSPLLICNIPDKLPASEDYMLNHETRSCMVCKSNSSSLLRVWLNFYWSSRYINFSTRTRLCCDYLTIGDAAGVISTAIW
jgi:hypothetical protein